MLLLNDPAGGHCEPERIQATTSGHQGGVRASKMCVWVRACEGTMWEKRIGRKRKGNGELEGKLECTKREKKDKREDCGLVV